MWEFVYVSQMVAGFPAEHENLKNLEIWIWSVQAQK